MSDKENKLHIIHAYGGKRFSLTVKDIKDRVPEGWDLVMESLIHDLLEMGWDGQIIDVKEKYGTLRFYTGPLTDKMHERVRQAEHQTAYVCAKCGSLANLTNRNGYISPRCKEHIR